MGLFSVESVLLCVEGSACPSLFQDHGNSFTYTGSGGRDLSGNKRTAEQSCDQKLTNTNRFAEAGFVISSPAVPPPRPVAAAQGWGWFCFGVSCPGS